MLCEWWTFEHYRWSSWWSIIHGLQNRPVQLPCMTCPRNMMWKMKRTIHPWLFTMHFVRYSNFDFFYLRFFALKIDFCIADLDLFGLLLLVNWQRLKRHSENRYVLWFFGIFEMNLDREWNTDDLFKMKTKYVFVLDEQTRQHTNFEILNSKNMRKS